MRKFKRQTVYKIIVGVAALSVISSFLLAYAAWFVRWIREQSLLAVNANNNVAAAGASGLQNEGDLIIVRLYTKSNSPPETTKEFDQYGLPVETICKSGVGWHDTRIWSSAGAARSVFGPTADLKVFAERNGFKPVDSFDPPIDPNWWARMPEWTLKQRYGWPIPFIETVRCSIDTYPGGGMQLVSLYGGELRNVLGWSGVATVIPMRLNLLPTLLSLATHGMFWFGAILAVIVWRRRYGCRQLRSDVCPSCGYVLQRGSCPECGRSWHQPTG